MKYMGPIGYMTASCGRRIAKMQGKNPDRREMYRYAGGVRVIMHNHDTKGVGKEATGPVIYTYT